jgi:hypothetical protein
MHFTGDDLERLAIEEKLAVRGAKGVRLRGLFREGCRHGQNERRNGKRGKQSEEDSHELTFGTWAGDFLRLMGEGIESQGVGNARFQRCDHQLSNDESVLQPDIVIKAD